jgi:hypothetical protein
MTPTQSRNQCKTAFLQAARETSERPEAGYDAHLAATFPGAIWPRIGGSPTVLRYIREFCST